eukprot:CAMPEP_0119096530 /NCGR_PEP_ID=MMETSP1178-20130426/173150_1 /TAXON_ID=33656 /ORGANISM="unid sp, Strain CCMP2000" /LENGTH=41 /DNA_ID= /DNA_START= /DNA_END= /DNA_ORIENTATION=
MAEGAARAPLTPKAPLARNLPVDSPAACTRSKARALQAPPA